METPSEKKCQVISEISLEPRVVSIEPVAKRRKRTRLSRWMCRFGKTDSRTIVISDFSDDGEEREFRSGVRLLYDDEPDFSEGEYKPNGGGIFRPIEFKAFKRTYFHGFPCDENGTEETNQPVPVGMQEELLENDLISKPRMLLNDGFQGSRRKTNSCKCLALTRKHNPCTYPALGIFCTRHGNYGSKFIHRIARQNLKEDENRNYREIPFSGRSGQHRCIGLGSKGELCVNQSVDGTAYCYTHAEDNSDYTGVESMPNFSADDVSESSTANSSHTVSDKKTSDGSPRPYKYKEFIRMWTDCEDFFGEGTDEIESTRRVRGANSRVSPADTDGQLKAQYGRLLPSAMKILMSKVLQLKREDVFLDIGHGIGNACIQAAFTFGCEARGIEVVADRNSVAEVFRDHLQSQAEEHFGDRIIGDIHLEHGRLEDIEHREFLTEGITRAYVNNFNGVFADRSSKGNQKWYLDDYVAGLFALMQPGTLMITLHPLNLGPTREEANDSRKKQGLSESDNSSFYEVERILLGKACDTVKWTQLSGNRNNIYIYKYTRLEQESEETVFLCCNPSCTFAKNDVPIPATALNEEDRVVINHCECKITAKNLRRHTRKSYS